MNHSLTIRLATKEEVGKYFYEWPRGEHWNPCLGVTDFFYSSDPNGFFLGTVKNEQGHDTVVAIISALKHNPEMVFIGHYIVHPDHRGKGYGLALFNHAVKDYSKGVKYIGLDAVHAQMNNYKKSGFNILSWNSRRYQGTFEQTDLAKRMEKNRDYLTNAGLEIKPLSETPLQSLIQLEKKYAGIEREAFIKQVATTFKNPSEGKFGISLVKKNDPNQVVAYAAIRPLTDGYIIGPIYAENKQQTSTLVCHLIDVIHTESEKSTYQINKDHSKTFCANVCEGNKEALDIFENDFGWTWAFQCYRMWIGEAPPSDVSGLYAAATYESG
ncbi:acyl-CoA N-acyltransferase [Cunninghamella echinulata]|nr:acyl-CoA N-acyltransferase [Cunninghamella echinulata]